MLEYLLKNPNGTKSNTYTRVIAGWYKISGNAAEVNGLSSSKLGISMLSLVLQHTSKVSKIASNLSFVCQKKKRQLIDKRYCDYQKETAALSKYVLGLPN